MTAVTQEKREEIVKMIQAGMSVMGISEELNLSTPTIYKTLREEGLRPSARVGVKTPEQIEAVIADYYAVPEIPTPVILSKHGVTYGQLYAYLHTRGLKPRTIPDGSHSEVEAARKIAYDKAVEMYVAGEPGWKIVAETGVATPVLYNELHRRGLKLKSRNWGRG